jgi:hypothetical protein
VTRRTPEEEERLIETYRARDAHRARAIRLFGEETVHDLFAVARAARSHALQQRIDRATKAELEDALFVTDRLEWARARASPARHDSRDNVIDGEAWQRICALLEEAIGLAKEHVGVASALVSVGAPAGRGRPSPRSWFVEAVCAKHPDLRGVADEAWANLGIAVGLDDPEAQTFGELRRLYADLLAPKKPRRRPGKTTRR